MLAVREQNPFDSNEVCQIIGLPYYVHVTCVYETWLTYKWLV